MRKKTERGKRPTTGEAQIAHTKKEKVKGDIVCMPQSMGNSAAVAATGVATHAGGNAIDHKGGMAQKPIKFRIQIQNVDQSVSRNKERKRISLG